MLSLLLLCLSVGTTVVGQNVPGTTSRTSVSNNQQIISADPADSELQIANPFSTPWLLDSQIAVSATAAKRAPETTTPAQPPEKAKYKLTPNPFNSDLYDTGPGEAINASVGSKSPQRPDTAQRLAVAPPTQPETATKQAKAVKAKYDVTRIGDRGVGTNLNFYSIEKEEALGREISQQVEQQAKLITDPAITEYVNRVGQNLVRHSDARVPFTIKVVDDEQVNAFALPGGFFYVNSGVLLAADNEAELAGVMAHEIAHVAARHVTRNATKQDIWNLASLPLIFVGGPVGAAIRQMSGIAVPMSFLKFSRDAEREADFLGLEYQYASGYDPTAFVDFFEKLEAQEKHHSGIMAKAFSTHPMNDDRIRRAEAELEMLPARDDYILTTSEFDQIKTRLIRLTRGRTIDDGKSGAPTLRKHTVEDEKPPVLRKKIATMGQ
jgi:predicted Zn-dependent protease